MFIQISQLKNYSSSNLNRDDNGMPKSCLFGGIQRGRISSQCIKHNMRKDFSFIEALGGNIGIRTRHLPGIVVDKLRAAGANEKYIEAAKALVKAQVEGKKPKADKEDTSVEAEGAEQTSSAGGKEVVTQIVFFSKADVEATVKAVLEAFESSSSVAEFKKTCVLPKAQPITPDIALFGRMATSENYMSVDSAMQVAHAMSTNKLSSETDYFTAVDDANTSGAAHVNSFDFNSCCYYEYANIDTDKLKSNLDLCEAADEDLLRSVILGTIKAFAFTNPTGKQNSFAAHVLPSAFLVEISDNRIPINYANAFIQPVKNNHDKDLVQCSIEKLCDEVAMIDHDYGVARKHRFWFCSSKYDNAMSGAEKCGTFMSLMDSLEEVLKKEL